MVTNEKLDLDKDRRPISEKVYREIIGSLFFFLTTNRPNILFSVCLCARFQAPPKESHLTSVKRIFRYLACTRNLGL